MGIENPKLIDSHIIDCIPQTGTCPLNCGECFYNREGAFYRTLEEPKIPTLEETEGKLVRMNSGHDSNLFRSLVIETASKYKDVFFNTSLPLVDFPAPVVLTLNGQTTDRGFIRPMDVKGNLRNIMAVRYRTNTWNLDWALEAISNWSLIGCGVRIPFWITDMRYYNEERIREPEYYTFKKHILNEYWCLNEKGYEKVFSVLFKRPDVYWCGNPFTMSTYCKDCCLCEHAYAIAKIRMKHLYIRRREGKRT